MTTAAFDANVLAAGLIGLSVPTSTPGELIRRWLDDRFVLVISEYVFDEVRVAVAARYFRRRLTDEQIETALARFRAEARWVPITFEVSGVASHHHDDPVIATAVSAGADYLVTGDKELRAVGAHAGVTILTPCEFLIVLDSEVAEPR